MQGHPPNKFKHLTKQGGEGVHIMPSSDSYQDMVNYNLKCRVLQNTMGIQWEITATVVSIFRGAEKRRSTGNPVLSS